MEEPPNTHRFDAGTTEVLTVPAATGAAARPSGGFERYVPGAEIARGGMGRVMVGTDTRLGREVAIKEALPHGGDLLRFEREVRITARLEHPSIVPLYDAGVTADGRPFYVMRKVSGQPLDRLIQRAGGPADRRRLALLPHVLAAAHALGHAHRRGVIHRDVKPSNILVGELGETVVIDWGLAKVIGEDEAGPAPALAAADGGPGELSTQTGAVFGTPSYMAPEQARAEPLDPRSDVYALGATLCHVLTGRPPLPGQLTDVLAGARDAARAAPALAQLAALALPPELTAIVDQAMQFDPARRYPDDAALADDLNRFLAGRLVAAHRYTRAERLGRWIRRHRALVAVVAGSALTLATGGALAIRGVVLARERTWQAEQRARTERGEAEAARLREADRADEDLIVRARTEVERDPTTATAILTGLPAGSRRWPEARAIAIEARLRGVAQVYSEEHVPRAFALGPDPAQLLVAGSTTGKVAIIDLAHRRERTLDACAGRCTAAWGAGGAAVWIGPAAGGLYAVDVATGARHPPLLPVGPDALAADPGPVPDGKIVELLADPAATLAGVALHDGRAATLDAAGLHYLSGLTGKVESLVVAPDGTWAAFASRRELVVVDRAARELARATAELSPATLVAAPAGGQLAIATAAGAVLEAEVTGGKAAIRQTALPWRVFLIRYVHNRPYVNRSDRAELRSLHALDGRIAETDRVLLSGETWRGTTAIINDKIELLGPEDARPLVPPVHDQILAIAGRRDARYFAAHTRSAILTWDLAEVIPDPVARDVNRAWLFDDRTALVSELDRTAWVDLATGARTPIAAPRGIVVDDRADVATGRALLVVLLPGPDQPLAAVLARRGRSEVTPIELPGWQRINLSGSNVLAGTAAGDVVVIGDGAAPRVLYRFGAPVDTVVGSGPWVAAHAASGAVVRIDLATGATDTARPPSPTEWLLVTARGDVYLSADRTILRWRGGGFERIATLPGRIDALVDFHDGERVLAATPQHEFYAVDPDQADEARRTVRLFFRSDTPPLLDRTQRYLVANTPGGEATLFDLTQSTQWRIPSTWQVRSLSPSARTALLIRGGSTAVLHLDAPDDPAALRAWITGATNYGLDAPAP